MSTIVQPATERPTRRQRWLHAAAALTIAVAFAACGKNPGGPTPTPTPTPPGGGGTDTGDGTVLGTNILVGAGDIAECNGAGAVATALLLDRIAGQVFTSGDNVYFDGTPTEFRDCYGPTWGRHKARTKPAPGNHDYQTAGATGYYAYFGAAAGPPGLGYYRFSMAGWTILSLNSEPTGNNPAQLAWVRSELTSNPTPCTIAIWHRPLFSSGANNNQPDMLELWKTLYELNVDVIINGHDHIYERFDRQNPDGQADPVKGIQQFTVGTGGAASPGLSTIKNNSVIRIGAWGVAKFTLLPGSYTWEFIPIDGASGTDFGTGQCH